MNGNSYIPGAVCLAKSLKTKYDKICMVTDDVSESAISTLKSHFTHVVPIQKIVKKFRGLRGRKQKTIYTKEFLSTICTKLMVLSLTRYKKVCFVDADVLFVKSPDSIFKLSAPAGSFIDPWSRPVCGSYGPLYHGQAVTLPNMKDEKSFVAIGSFMLLEPSEDAMKRFRSILDSCDVYGLNIGTKNSPDEIMIAEVFPEGWSNISIRYHIIYWKWIEKIYGKKLNKDDIIGYHYFNKEKPWMRKREDWPKSYEDIGYWYDVYDNEEKVELPIPVRIRIKGGKIIQDCEVYMGRPCNMGGWSKVDQVSKGNKRWCNPYKGPEAAEKYEIYIREKIDKDPTMLKELKSFGGITIGCWCSPTKMGTIDKPICHAMVIVKIYVEKFL
uniref:DUF4326 domain-containing protein n=1 Tax=Pithovirus LCPAC403 TaxID=2506596 RepID=A0A481ZB57_9VIRU|nr:MAG: uncharacterized protein LCPAC403_02980 [Pithovirus LCPAC403]